MSELLTNALRHALPDPADISPGGPIRLGLLYPGPMRAVRGRRPKHDGSGAPSTPVSLAETGRGLHIIYALSDQWGYPPRTTPARSCGPSSIRTSASGQRAAQSRDEPPNRSIAVLQ